MAALAASLAAFGVGMFTYDTFSFVQVTFIAFVMLAFGAVALSAREAATLDQDERPAPARLGPEAPREAR